MMTKNKLHIGRFLLLMLQGALVGCGAILPGVSGGVLCATFGIYEPIMDFLANPFKGFRRHVRLLIPVILGGLIGFIGLAKLVSLIMGGNMFLSAALFAGLICGTFPSLARDSLKEKPHAGWIGFILALFLPFVIFSYLLLSGAMTITPNFGWFVFCGAIWASSMVIPGLSSSSLLVFMGLYLPMNDGIGNVDFHVLIPLFIGFVPTLLLLAKPVHYLLKRYNAYFSKVVLGFMASSVMIMMLDKDVRPTEFSWVIPVAIPCFAIGFALAVWMGYMESRRDDTDASPAVAVATEESDGETAEPLSADDCEDIALPADSAEANSSEEENNA